MITLMTFISNLFAQLNLKIGHINSQELLQAMPENDSAQVKLEKATKEIQDQYKAMQVEYSDKYQDFISKRDSYSDLIKQTKSMELQSIEQRIQEFQQNAEQGLQMQKVVMWHFKKHEF